MGTYSCTSWKACWIFSSQYFPLMSNWAHLQSNTVHQPAWGIRTEALEWGRVVPSKRKETPTQVFLQGDVSERVLSTSEVAPWFQPPSLQFGGFHHSHLWIAKTWLRFPVSPSELSLDSLIWKQTFAVILEPLWNVFFFLVHDLDSFMIYDVCTWDAVSFSQHNAIF